MSGDLIDRLYGFTCERGERPVTMPEGMVCCAVRDAITEIEALRTAGGYLRQIATYSWEDLDAWHESECVGDACDCQEILGQIIEAQDVWDRLVPIVDKSPEETTETSP